MRRGFLLAAFCVAMLPTFASAGALQQGNIIVSNSPFGVQSVYEYSTAGTRLQTFDFSPAADGRDLILDRDGRVQIYNGTFSPSLTSLDPVTNARSSRTFGEWSTVNNLTYGGIGAFGRYVFATDMNTSSAGASGVVRFDLDGGPTVRFATNTEPLDLSVGLDGLLYTLSRGNAFNGGGNQVDVYNPTTLAYVRSVTLPGEHRGIAVDARSHIFTAQRDSVSRINHYSPAGQSVGFLDDPGIGGLADIDLNRDGGIVVASHGGSLIVTTTALTSATTFQTRSSNGYNFAAWVQAPVSETPGVPIPGLFNTGLSSTGALLPEGSTDPHYTLTSVPTGSGYASTPFVTVSDGFPIGSWIGNGPNSQWIQPLSGNSDSHAVGEYVYRTTFSLDGFDISKVLLYGRWSHDDGATILLNGVPTSFTGGSNFNSWSQFALDAGFVEGVNTLDFVVSNGGAPTGLRVEIAGYGTPIPEPAIFGIITASAASRTLHRRRRPPVPPDGFRPAKR